MAASYPTSAKSFTTKNTSDTIQAAHVNDLQDEVTAIEGDLVAGLPVARGGTGQSASGTAGQALLSGGSGQPMTWGVAALTQTFRGLTLRTHPDADVAAYKVYLDHADEITMHDGTRVANWDDLTADITASGANGLDTGSEGASRWYSIHAIRKSSDGTKGLLLHRAKSYDANQSDTTTVNAEGNLNYSTSVVAAAQGVTPSVTGYRPFVDFNLNKQGSPTGQMYVEIYADSGGSPTGAALAVSDKLDVSLVPTSGRIWVRFVFRAPVSLTASTQYHYVVKATSTVSTTNYLSVGANTTNSYAGGVAKRWDGAAWQTSSVSGFSAVDFNFRDYVTQNDTALTLPSGYDQYAQVGWVYNNSSSDFATFRAKDRTVAPLKGYSGGNSGAVTATIATLIDFSAYLPPVPVVIGGTATHATSYVAVGGIPDGLKAPNNPPEGGTIFCYPGNGTGFPNVPVEMQSVYMSVGAGTGYYYITEWTW